MFCVCWSKLTDWGGAGLNAFWKWWCQMVSNWTGDDLALSTRVLQTRLRIQSMKKKASEEVSWRASNGTVAERGHGEWCTGTDRRWRVTGGASFVLAHMRLPPKSIWQSTVPKSDRDPARLSSVAGKHYSVPFSIWRGNISFVTGLTMRSVLFTCTLASLHFVMHTHQGKVDILWKNNWCIRLHPHRVTNYSNAIPTHRNLFFKWTIMENWTPALWLLRTSLLVAVPPEFT